MDVLDQAQRLAASGQQQAAVDLVLGAAGADDPVALVAVANWRLFGLYGERDLAEAHRLLDRAVARGDGEAVRLKATLMANGTGCSADLAAAVGLLESIRAADPGAALQLRLLEAMRPERAYADRPFEALSADPDIRVYRGLLTAGECEYLIARAQPELRPSFVVDPASGGHMPHPTRTSSGMNFDPTMEDPVVHQINRRLAAVTATNVACGEPLHVLRYAPGQEYRPHLDAIPGAGNQRVWTALTYLNDEFGGGETRFDLLDLAFRGSAGDALVFRNADANGNADLRLRHAGVPVSAGVKWLASRWIRALPHDPWTATY
jgi:prolyl 4-hydroxylase